MLEAGALPHWSEVDGVLERVLADLLHAELRRMRPGGPPPPPAWRWESNTRLDEYGPVGADSLELLSLSAAAAELVGDEGADLLAEPTLGAWCDLLRQRRTARPATGMPFRTSGSTGAPKRHLHSLAVLETEAACLAAILGTVGPGKASPGMERRRVLSAVPLHHAYGFIHGVLLPRHLGAPGQALPVLDLRPHAPGALAALLRPGDLVLGHPAWWEAVVAAVKGSLPDDVVGVTSTAPCPPALAHAVAALGMARLLQVYGSSEMAGMGWRDAPDDPFTLLPCWRRAGEGMRRDGNAAITEPPDLVEWETPDRFRIIGRRDGAVQVGGHNVYPARVRAHLLLHPAVADAAVRPTPAEQGGRLKVFVVPRPGAPEVEALRHALAAHVETGLSPPERPRSYTFGDALPRNEIGKAMDWLQKNSGFLG